MIQDTEQLEENTEQEREAVVQQATAQVEIHSRDTEDTQKDKIQKTQQKNKNIRWLSMQDIRRMEIRV